MITRILLRNFQKHKKLDIRFGEVTTLIGATDTGKSAIIRALRWVATNLPKGKSFIHHGAKKCSVTLWVDGHKIKRTRTASTNTYWMDGLTYNSFSNGVPEPIANVLRLKEENFQQQHDPIFWLSLSPTEVSKRLNEIADLQIMDDSIRKSLALKKEAQFRLKFVREQRDKLKESFASMEDIPAMMVDFTRLKKVKEFIAKKRADFTRLRNLLEISITAHESTERLETGLSVLRKLCEDSEALQTLKHRRTYLSISIRCVKIDLPSPLKITSLSMGIDSLTKNITDARFLADLITDYKFHSSKESQCLSRLSTLKDLITQTSVACPTCGRPMPTEK